MPRFSDLAQPKDVEGWGKTKWGMTEEQLLNIFEGQVERLPRNEECHGGCATLRINDMEIEGSHFKVYLHLNYTTNKLDHVAIEPEGEHMDDAAFDSLIRMLIQKYGAPTSQKDDKNIFGQTKKRTWIFPSTVIELSWMELSGALTILNYKPNNKEDNL